MRDGYVVMLVPKTGLFLKRGKLVSGDGKKVTANAGVLRICVNESECNDRKKEFKNMFRGEGLDFIAMKVRYEAVTA
jgi:hypothetical protein